MSNIVGLISKVMEEVGAVKKGDRNQSQNFSFRGVDAVTNAVSPALRKHGVVVSPQVMDYQHETVQTSQGKNMASVRVLVRYTFHAPDGSTLEAVVPGESFDAGDKATAKAMSVAFRIALLQALCLPTDDTDPDATSYERAGHPTTHQPKQQIKAGNKQVGTAAQVVPIAGGKLATEDQISAIGKIGGSMKMDSQTLGTFVDATVGRQVADLYTLSIQEASDVIKALNEAKGGGK